MSNYFYLVAYPMEALIVSMLQPEEFGAYMSIGTQRMSRGKIIFLEVDPTFRSKDFDFDRALNECKANEQGQPKRSVYLSSYRVLERVPLSAIRSIHLVTKDGRNLSIPGQRIDTRTGHPRRGGVYFYQELAPARPMVVSQYDPLDFGRFLTDEKNPIHFPKILFARMKLGPSPMHVLAQTDLPYHNLFHLESCIRELVDQKKDTKVYERDSHDDFLYSSIIDGVYLVEPGSALFFPFPEEADLKDRHFTWWRSAF